jgi:predicted kinase/ribosomal protein S17
MRILLLLTGAPGAGKSTFVQNAGLTQYTLSPDEFRLAYQSPEISAEGNYYIPQDMDHIVWKTMFQVLEARMERGEFTVIDATLSKRADFNKFKKLANKYRYRIYTISFRSVPIEQCKAQNRARVGYKQVPEEVIDRQYARFANDQIGAIPAWANPVDYRDTQKVNELITNIVTPIDYTNEYDVIHFIGDIHGCYKPLEKFFAEFPVDNQSHKFVFVGDYIDRGIQNREVIEFLLQIYEQKNVTLLEGNHEKWLTFWAHDELENIRSREFIRRTMPQLEGINKKALRQLCRRFAQLFYGEFHGKFILATHGGVPTTHQLQYIATQQLINGAGNYEDHQLVADAFVKRNPENCYLVHGHRNVFKSPVQVNKRVFNLEGSIEHGGSLRVVSFRANGDIVTRKYRNEVFRVTNPSKTADLLNVDNNIEDLTSLLEADSNIKVQDQTPFGHPGIKSYNFRREVFFKSNWDKLNVRARGLFVNVNKNEVAARGYDKFFNIGERKEVRPGDIASDWVFPVNMYMKYNGFLGLLGWDSNQNKMMFCSKSTTGGPFAQLFKDIFDKTISADARQAIVDTLRDGYCFVFEVIHPSDPHIVDITCGQDGQLILLDILARDVVFRPMPYSQMKKFAIDNGIAYKQLVRTFEKPVDFLNWYYRELPSNEEEIEGWVLVDSFERMVKVKTEWYLTWKKLRKYLDRFKKANPEHLVELKQSELVTPIEMKAIQFMNENRSQLQNMSIIDVRHAITRE